MLCCYSLEGCHRSCTRVCQDEVTYLHQVATVWLDRWPQGLIRHDDLVEVYLLQGQEGVGLTTSAPTGSPLKTQRTSELCTQRQL